MKNINKKLLVKGLVSSSLVLSMSGVFAHSILSLHTHPVPLSLTSTVVLGILLIFTGLFILPRMQGRHIRTLATTSLLVGLITAGVSGKLINETLAALPLANCTINNANSTTGCPANIPTNQDILISNLSDDDITVNSVADAINNARQRQNHSLKIVELVKGPIKRSVVVSYPPCSFPHILAPNAACTFNHIAVHGGGVPQ